MKKKKQILILLLLACISSFALAMETGTRGIQKRKIYRRDGRKLLNKQQLELALELSKESRIQELELQCVRSLTQRMINHIKKTYLAPKTIAQRIQDEGRYVLVRPLVKCQDKTEQNGNSCGIHAFYYAWRINDNPEVTASVLWENLQDMSTSRILSLFASAIVKQRQNGFIINGIIIPHPQEADSESNALADYELLWLVQEYKMSNQVSVIDVHHFQDGLAAQNSAAAIKSGLIDRGNHVVICRPQLPEGEGIAHWITLFFERLPDNKIGVIWFDSAYSIFHDIDYDKAIKWSVDTILHAIQ